MKTKSLILIVVVSSFLVSEQIHARSRSKTDEMSKLLRAETKGYEGIALHHFTNLDARMKDPLFASFTYFYAGTQDINQLIDQIVEGAVDALVVPLFQGLQLQAEAKLQVADELYKVLVEKMEESTGRRLSAEERQKLREVADAFAAGLAAGDREQLQLAQEFEKVVKEVLKILANNQTVRRITKDVFLAIQHHVKTSEVLRIPGKVIVRDLTKKGSSAAGLAAFAITTHLNVTELSQVGPLAQDIRAAYPELRRASDCFTWVSKQLEGKGSLRNEKLVILVHTFVGGLKALENGLGLMSDAANRKFAGVAGGAPVQVVKALERTTNIAIKDRVRWQERLKNLQDTSGFALEPLETAANKQLPYGVDTTTQESGIVFIDVRAGDQMDQVSFTLELDGRIVDKVVLLGGQSSFFCLECGKSQSIKVNAFNGMAFSNTNWLRNKCDTAIHCVAKAPWPRVSYEWPRGALKSVSVGDEATFAISAKNVGMKSIDPLWLELDVVDDEGKTIEKTTTGRPSRETGKVGRLVFANQGMPLRPGETRTFEVVYSFDSDIWRNPYKPGKYTLKYTAWEGNPGDGIMLSEMQTREFQLKPSRAVQAASKPTEVNLFTVEAGKVWEISLSPDGKSIAVTAESGGRMFVIRDGVQIGEKYDSILSYPIFSPDGHSLVFVARSGNKGLVILDGAPIGAGYERLWVPVFSPDGHSLAFAAKLGSKWFVVRDGATVGGEYDELGFNVGLLFSPDSRSLAFRAKSRGKWFIIRDGDKVGGEYDFVVTPSLAFSPDGHSTVFIAMSNDKKFVIKDGVQVGGKYDDVGSLVFSPDGRSLAFGVRDGVTKIKEGSLTILTFDKSYIIKDGLLVADNYDCARWPSFAPDGSLVFYAKLHGKWFLLKDGEPLTPSYDDLWGKVFDSDSRLRAIVARSGQKVRVIKDGVQLGGQYADVHSLVLSPDNRSLAFEAKVGGKSIVIKDGVQVGGNYESVSALCFSPDGCSVVFHAKSGAKEFMVKDGIRVGGEYDLVGWTSLVFGPDGRSLAFEVDSSGKRLVIKNDVQVGTVYDKISEIKTSADGTRLVFAGIRGETVYRVEAQWQELP